LSRRTVSQKQLPSPGVLTTPASPPIRRAMLRVMARPSPVPPNLRVGELSAWVKGSKSVAACSGVMPMPVSITSKRSR
jgi:hypothetical protein